MFNTPLSKCVGVLGIFLLAILEAALGAQKADPAIARGIQILSEQRDKAETQISLLQGMLADQDISQKEFRIGKAKYGEAQGAFNGWIDRLLYDLRQGKEFSSSQDYQLALDNAAAKGDAFIEYVQQLLLGESRNPAVVVGVVSALLPLLTEAATAFWDGWKEYNQTEQERKDKQFQSLKTQLEPLKWRKFDEVLAEVPGFTTGP